VFNFCPLICVGANPTAGLIADKAGDFFGTTIAGGEHYYGAVFEFKNKSHQ
jgi:hypothetical protein